MRLQRRRSIISYIFGRSSAALAGKDKGFTLIELVLVIVFLSFVILSSMRLMSSSAVKSVNTELLATATDLANEKMERIFADKNTRGYGFILSQNYATEANASGMTGFTRSVAITDLTMSKMIAIRIQHADLDDLVLVAYLTNY